MARKSAPVLIPDSLKAVVTGACLGALLWFEHRRALRQVCDSKIRRDARNMMVAALAGAVVQAAEVPVVSGLVRWTAKKKWGLSRCLPFPSRVRDLFSILMLDYTLYLWHVLTHRVPFLWRFHKAHHIDREMDATTALRFHFGEIALSVPFRAAQLLVIGPSQSAVSLWRLFLFLSILFHHSNVRLPLGMERLLANIVMTPRLHGIHHSVAPDEVNSNWSSGLTVWDWLHGTLVTELRDELIVIGVRGYLDDCHQKLTSVLLTPLDKPGIPA